MGGKKIENGNSFNQLEGGILVKVGRSPKEEKKIGSSFIILKNWKMNLIQKIGILLFIAAFLFFTFLAGWNTFKLTEESINVSNTNHKTEILKVAQESRFHKGPGLKRKTPLILSCAVYFRNTN